MGLAPDSAARIRGSLTHVLRGRCEVRGHSFLPRGELVRECLAFLNHGATGPQAPRIAAERVRREIDDLLAADGLVCESPDAIYLPEVHEAEVDLARRIQTLQRTALPPAVGLDVLLAKTEAQVQIAYAHEQHQAIRAALSSPIAVVTGGPGTGKSTVIRGVIAAFCLLQERPTFQRNEGHPIAGDLLVVDEASMVDLNLADALFRAVPAGMRILLVGDADQLPSVGFGNFFADLIRSGTLPVVRLSEIFRQARESRIVVNAHRVNQGRMPILDQVSDCQFVACDEGARAADFIRSAALSYRAAGLALDEINVLSPMRKTQTGVVALNKLLQEALNPPSEEKREIAAGEAVFRAGDKVMQIRNNYEKGVFNGDGGIIESIDLPDDEEEQDEAERITVNFQGTRVTYEKREIDQLVLSYACTVHKAQGSEYKGVVLIPLLRDHWVMLARNLLYTAITRAKERVILVGQESAIRRAVSNAGSRLRYSRLSRRLKERSDPPQHRQAASPATG